MLKAYYKLTKPGIVYGNLFTVLAGYLFGSGLHIAWLILAAVMLGMAFVIAGACVFNNVLDRDIDAKMDRTRERATVTGAIPLSRALLYGSVLALSGFTVLLFHTTTLTAEVALVGFFFYVVVYGYAKRVTRTHTLIGSISGAVPIIAGFSAATGALDTRALLLFIILVLWQMPHFYAISIYRLDQYRAAGIPLLPSSKGMRITKVVVVSYIVAFMLAEASLTLLGYTGYTYLAIVLGFGIAWLTRAVRGFSVGDDVAWAKQLFFFSINVLTAFCVALALGVLLV